MYGRRQKLSKPRKQNIKKPKNVTVNEKRIKIISRGKSYVIFVEKKYKKSLLKIKIFKESGIIVIT